MGRAAIKTSFLNNAISLFMGLIIGLVLIGLVEESLDFVAFPPLLALVLGKGFVVWGYHIAIYQLVVLANAVIWGLNLGPGLLAIVETGWQKPPIGTSVPATELESSEISLIRPGKLPQIGDGAGLHLLNEVYSQYEQGQIDAEEYKRVRKQLVHEWHLARQTTASVN
jgi:hypothetical protein